MEIISEIKRFLKTSSWLTPVNLITERDRFLTGVIANPHFVYPELPTVTLKSYLLKLETIPPNPRINELTLILRLLLARGTSAISQISHNLYGCSYPENLIAQAEVDAQLPGDFIEQDHLTAEAAQVKTQDYLTSLGLADWQVLVSDLRDFYVRVKGSSKTILVSREINWDFCDFDNLLAHEIDGHVLRAVNASRQTDPLFQKPWPFYLKTEEGLASFLGDYLSPKTAQLSRKHHALKYLAGHLGQTASFRELYTFFMDHGFTSYLAFRRTFRLKRGLEDASLPGTNGKESMYYQGMLEVKAYLDQGGSVAKLYAGKVGLTDLDSVPVPPNELIPARLRNYPLGKPIN